MAEVVVGLDSILVLQEKTNNTLQPTGIPFFRKKGPMVMIPSNDKNSGGENQTLHRFDFVTINVATKNFSEANRISQLKTDDSLYKGRLQNGQGIAVARIPFLTKYDCFMEEASILVEFEHENLAKLLGYCIEETYLFFVYHFALNATTDCLMFGMNFHVEM
ncbi:putative inactive receptor-like kinase BSK12 [Bidens hawaiensis]|uniref:putative inactive receptor-like kinase BSK12 n=1 Tax=Bidens hawaiensis TaxID=980011 RepID=UPI00404A7BE7